MAWIIKEEYPNAKVRLEYCPSFDLSMHIDILVIIDSKWIHIELKYKTKECIKNIISTHYVYERVDIFMKKILLIVITLVVALLVYVNVNADESILDEKGNISLEKFVPISYDPATHGYYKVQGRVGNAFSDGNKLK